MEHSIDAQLSTLLARIDLDTTVRLLSGQDMFTLPAVPDIGLESLVMSDGPIGVRGSTWQDPAIALPCPTALAATWDIELARTAGRLLGLEARRKGVHVLLAPTVNLHRAPRGGRHFECFSEDPYLTGAMAAAFAAGVQEQGVAATAKHFVANDSETERRTVDVRVSEQALRELYLLPFEMLVRSGVWAVMAAYNSVNGATMTEHASLLRDVLKGEWGFDGVVISDWMAARTTEQTALGGLDIAMPALGNPWGDELSDAVRADRVPAEVVQEQAERVLRLATRVGALGSGPPPPLDTQPPAMDGRAVARELAARSFVLARNDGVLPLRPNVSIAVIGYAASATRLMGGGSAEVPTAHQTSFLDGLRDVLPQATYSIGTDARATLPEIGGPHWSPDTVGRFRDIGTLPLGQAVRVGGVYTPQVAGVHQFSVRGIGALRLTVDGATVWEGQLWPDPADPASFLYPSEERVPVRLEADRPVEVMLSHEVSTPATSIQLGHQAPGMSPDELMEEAVLAAGRAEVAIVVVGSTEEMEREGYDRVDLALPGRQDELVTRVLEANPRTVVVVNAGAPVLLPWAQRVPALMLTWLPGQEAGGALADVLLGRAEPAGRMPTTWPMRAQDVPVDTVEPQDGVLRYQEETFIGYQAWERAGLTPLFPFGHGLGYTTWEYADLTVTQTRATVTVRNTGARTGYEVVQVYLAQGNSRRLAGFATVSAAPGVAVTAHVSLPLRAFQRWMSSGWETQPGRYEVQVGHSCADVRLRTFLTV